MNSSLSWLSEPSDRDGIKSELVSLVEREYAKRHGGDELKTIYIFLTRKCNLGCQHCYIEGVGPKAKGIDFNFDTIKGLIEQARPHGLRKVKVSGGEPMVHKEFMRIMDYLGSIGLQELVLETNGTLFKEDTVGNLASIPNLTVFISLDHAQPGQHDGFRGRAGAFEKTATALKALGGLDIGSVVTTTAYRDNYDKILEIVELVFSWGIKRHRTLLNIHPMGNARGHLDNAITLDECEVLISSLLASRHFDSGRAYMTLPPALMPLKVLKSIHTCGWGDNVLGILSNGDISMCSASYDDPNMIGGNVAQQPLMDIWRNSRFFQDLRDISGGAVKGVCSNCVFYKVCRGVCKMSSYSHYGEKDAPYPLCQEIYNNGAFPTYALIDPTRNVSYGGGAIRPKREPKAAEFAVRLGEVSAAKGSSLRV
jgi:radical SAM protein with 4Fe4S-binding SPASM domain